MNTHEPPTAAIEIPTPEKVPIMDSAPHAESREVGELTFAQLHTTNVTRCRTAFHSVTDWSETDWACAAAGEMGELCNLIKKRRRGDPIDDKRVADEMADVVIYIDLLAARMDIDLAAAIVSKFNEVSERVCSDAKL